MRIVVPIKQVPDLVEELELLPEGTDLDRDLVTFKLNEYDDHALEEALCLKEALGAEVVVVGLDEPEIDQSLFTALAKGADRAVKVTGDLEGWIDTHRRAALLGSWLASEPFDLVLVGVQAVDDLDGQVPALLGARLGVPHISVVTRVEPSGDGTAVVHQEYSGGLAAELVVRLPAVVGVQAARQAPRYASITRVRQAMQEGSIEEVQVAEEGADAGLRVRRLYAPEASGHAEMLDGDVGEVAERILELLRTRGLLKA